MATENKITKRDILTHIAEAMADDAVVVEFCEKEIASLDAKAVKAKERADKKRAEGDELQAIVASLLTAEPQTAEQLLAQIEDESGELTKQKIVSKMTNLIKFGQASKTTITIEVDGKNVKRVAYTTYIESDAE